MSWTAYRAMARERFRLLRLLRHAGTGAGTALVAASVFAAVLPASLAVATGWLLHSAARVAAGRDRLSTLAPALVVVVALLILIQLADSGRDVAAMAAGRRIDGWVRRRVRELVVRPAGIAHLLDPSTKDDLSRAGDLGRQHGRQRSPGTAATGQTTLMFRMLAALCSAGVVADFSPLLAAFLFGGCVTMRAIIRRQWIYLVDLADQATPGERRMEYWTELLTHPAAGKEVRVFGLGAWLVELRRTAALAAWDVVWRERRAVMRRQGTIIALTFATTLAALGAPGYAAATGRITAAQLASYLVAGFGVFGIGYMGFEAFDIEYGRGSVRALDRVEARFGRVPAAVGAAGTAGTGDPPGVSFRGVGFRYPGGDDVLDGLDLSIRPGEVLAIVGVNGAGKTTLAKLLAGLYQPRTGTIRVDGDVLSEPAVEPWRRRVAALFQDFIRYPLSLRENVAAGAPESMADTAGIRDALAAAGADDLLTDLPGGLDALLWPAGTGGVDLSGGQWQKVAIARILFAAAHGRRMLILDEPTAHLDIAAEAAFFDTVIAAARGASIVLISHRLATVRHADRIAVVSRGRVTESGSHAELLAGDGEYARLFRLQAARFDDPVGTAEKAVMS